MIQLFDLSYGEKYWFGELAYVFGDKQLMRDKTDNYRSEIEENYTMSNDQEISEIPAGNNEYQPKKWNEMWGFKPGAYSGDATDESELYGSYTINNWLLPDPDEIYLSWTSPASVAEVKSQYYTPYSKAKSDVPAFSSTARFDIWPEDEGLTPALSEIEDISTMNYVDGSEAASMRRICIPRHGKKRCYAGLC